MVAATATLTPTPSHSTREASSALARLAVEHRLTLPTLARILGASEGLVRSWIADASGAEHHQIAAAERALAVCEAYADCAPLLGRSQELADWWVSPVLPDDPTTPSDIFARGPGYLLVMCLATGEGPPLRVIDAHAAGAHRRRD